MTRPMTFDKPTTETICAVLGCAPADIRGIEPMKEGLTNNSYEFSVSGIRYVCRIPGDGTDDIISRESEAFSESVAKELGLDDAMIYISAETGLKISRYVENYSYPDPYDENDRILAMKTIRVLHDSKVRSAWDFDYMTETDRILALDCFTADADMEIHGRMKAVNSRLAGMGYETHLCHNDAWNYNMLKTPDGRITLIDWEYSGNAYPAADVAYFTASLDYSDDDYIHLAELYEGHALSEAEKWYYFAVMAIVMWYWYIWALYEEILGTRVDDKNLWLDKALRALERAEEKK